MAPSGRSDVVRRLSRRRRLGPAGLSRRLRAVEHCLERHHARGLLDFEYARPGDPLDDVAYVLEYVVPFRDDATCLRWHRFTKPPDRQRRLKLFAEAYGLASVDGLVDQVLTSQRGRVELVRRLADRGDRRQVDLVARGTSSNCRAGSNGQWRTVT